MTECGKYGHHWEVMTSFDEIDGKLCCEVECKKCGATAQLCGEIEEE